MWGSGLNRVRLLCYSNLISPVASLVNPSSCCTWWHEQLLALGGNYILTEGQIVWLHFVLNQ